jgi:hypothetical protein
MTSSCGVPGNITFVDVIRATKVQTNKLQCLTCNGPLVITCDTNIHGSLTLANPDNNPDTLLKITGQHAGGFAPTPANHVGYLVIQVNGVPFRLLTYP